MRILYALLALTLLCAPSYGQNRSKMRAQLNSMVAKANQDPAKLWRAIEFAKDNELGRRVIDELTKKILKLDPDHQGANESLGLVKHAGKWMEASKAEKLIAASLKEKYKAQGLVEIDGVWVKKEQVEDAKNGIYHYGDGTVNRWEMRQLLQGKVRHPITGGFIEPDDLEKAKNGSFPLGTAKWGTQAEADEYHKDPDHPWVVRSQFCNVVATLPLALIQGKIVGEADAAYRRLLPVFGGGEPAPNRRPTVVVLTTEDQYKDVGANFGGAGSAHGAFLATPRHGKRVHGSRSRVAFAHWDETWGPRLVRHATGLALSDAFCGDETDDLPIWFHRAIGAFVERHFTTGDAKFFGRQHLNKGGVKDLGKWLARYDISGDLPQSGFGDRGYNIFQAGLILSYCMRGGDRKATGALQKVSAAFAAGKKVGKAVKALEKLLTKREKQLQAFLVKTIS